MKQTAVEWLEKILKGQKEQPFDDYEWEIAFNHAKEMEKEQIIEFTNDYVLTQCSASFEGIVTVEMSTEKYYKQTVKSE